MSASPAAARANDAGGGSALLHAPALGARASHLAQLGTTRRRRKAPRIGHPHRRGGATNVLSSRAARGRGPRRRPLGDIVVCAPLLAREARLQDKPLRAHWAHIVIHGALHLLGFDHARAADARRMEKRERRLLARLGFADPYGA